MTHSLVLSSYVYPGEEFEAESETIGADRAGGARRKARIAADRAACRDSARRETARRAEDAGAETHLGNRGTGAEKPSGYESA